MSVKSGDVVVVRGDDNRETFGFVRMTRGTEAILNPHFSIKDGKPADVSLPLADLVVDAKICAVIPPGGVATGPKPVKA